MGLLKKFVAISRPRFWSYTAGPFLIGCLSAYTGANLNWDTFAIFLFYFTFPANLLIYGVNDIYDYETDKLNPKKIQYESLVEKSFHTKLWRWIIITNLPFAVFAIFTLPLRFSALVSLALFWFFAVFYSAPPIRAKTKPILDSAFNCLYIFPSAFAYFLFDGPNFDSNLFLAGCVWASGMHAFSAIPDISSDTKAGMKTIATLLKKNGTLLFCATSFVVSAALSSPSLTPWVWIFLCIYLIMILLSALSKDIFKIYKIFPFVNTLVGFLIFLVLAWQRLQWT